MVLRPCRFPRAFPIGFENQKERRRSIDPRNRSQSSCIESIRSSPVGGLLCRTAMPLDVIRPASFSLLLESLAFSPAIGSGAAAGNYAAVPAMHRRRVALHENLSREDIRMSRRTCLIDRSRAKKGG